MKRNKGISLIVLVITIIVIIILAGTVILSLASNNPIEQATEATFKESIKSYSSELDLYLTSQYATLLGSYDPELLEADSTKATYNGVAIAATPNIYSIITSIKTDNNNFTIKKGKLVYKGTNSNELDWVEEAAMENLNRPNLVLTTNIADNYINLKWDMHDAIQPYLYKVYQQKEGSNDFQSISTNDLKSNIKVLNIYPNIDILVPDRTITFTNWKNETFTLPVSASLKKWMEVPNGEDNKGYGKGLIDVVSVNQEEFNINPQLYLKNADQTWKYDVVVNGMADSNASNDFTQDSVNILKEYIRSGRGFLVGHDTFGATRLTAQIAELTNIKNFKDINVDKSLTVGSDTIKVNKTGLLMNYPWTIGDLGKELIIPPAHVTNLMAYGDVWVKFINLDQKYHDSWNIEQPITDNNGNGTNDFYLTTWNNTAMIQTGHVINSVFSYSTQNSTPDEQKLLANTLFYLSQLTNQTYLDDNSGQDVNGPTNPVITSAIINGTTGKVDIALSASTDVGSMYSYYVEAKGQNDEMILKTGIKTTTITSGLAGYSIIVDTVANTIPSNTVNTTTLNVSIAKPAGTNIYVHIKAIDNKGNVSSTIHLKAI